MNRQALSIALEDCGLSLNLLLDSYWGGKIPEIKLTWVEDTDGKIILPRFENIKHTVYSAVLGRDKLLCAICIDKKYEYEEESYGQWVISLNKIIENEDSLSEIDLWRLSIPYESSLSPKTAQLAGEIIFCHSLISSLRSFGFGSND